MIRIRIRVRVEVRVKVNIRGRNRAGVRYDRPFGLNLRHMEQSSMPSTTTLIALRCLNLGKTTIDQTETSDLYKEQTNKPYQ